MLTKVLPNNRTISIDEVIQFTNTWAPGREDPTEQQVKHNDWLRTKVREGQHFPWEVTDMWDRLFNTMRATGGVGLSANQIGIPSRSFVMETPKRAVKVAHPKIIEVSDIEGSMNEGCLSVGDSTGRDTMIDRPTSIVVEYFNGDDVVREGLVGLEARIFQHEYDHLNGFIFTDHAVIRRNLRKQMLLTAGEFHPTFLKYESAVGQQVRNQFFGPAEFDDERDFVYIDPASDALRTTHGNFRKRLLRLLDDNLFKYIEAW